MNWWKRDWKIWSAITLGILLSWGMYSFVGAVTDAPVNVSDKAQTRMNPVTFSSKLGVTGLGNMQLSGDEFTINGVASFLDTSGVKFSEDAVAIPGTVFYSTSDNCLAVYDESRVAKSLCGSVPPSACSCVTGTKKCDGDKLLTCTGTAGNCWKEETCGAPVVPEMSPLSGSSVSPYCFQKTATDAYCKQCVPKQKTCLSPSVAIEYTCSDEFTWGDKRTCPSNEKCVDGEGCVPNGIGSCNDVGGSNGCSQVGVQDCWGTTGTKVCTAVTLGKDRCLQWIESPCITGYSCKAELVNDEVYGYCVADPVTPVEPTTTVILKDLCQKCTSDGTTWQGNCKSGYSCVYGRCRMDTGGDGWDACVLTPQLIQEGGTQCIYRIGSNQFFYDKCVNNANCAISGVSSQPKATDSNYTQFKCPFQ